MANKAIYALTYGQDSHIFTLPYGTCSTPASTAAKTVAVQDSKFSLETGARVLVKFTVTNSASSPTLNVSSTGAKSIFYRGAAITASYLAANRVYEFVYDGTNWELIGDVDTNTKTTASSTNTSSKIFLIGATTQGSGKTTYSHDTAYVGTDGYLYSNSEKVWPRIYGTLVPYGTTIPVNADLNTITYLKVGNYYCSKNVDAATLTNCPTTSAFMMQVISPLATTMDNESTGTWVYRLRKLQVYTGEEYVQYCYSSGTAGNWTYGEWKKSIKSDNIATTTTHGLLSAADKTKLDGIATGANKYTHPTTAGNKHIPAGGSSGQILRWSADGTAAWGADNNTTYSAATQSAAGLMSAADKTKLDSIATGANKYTHPTTAGNKHIPSGGSSGQFLKYSASGTATWSSLPAASGTAAGITIVYPAASCTTFTSDTGTCTPAAVKKAVGMFNPKAHNHSASNITSGTLPIARGGTGATTAAGVLTKLGINATIAELNYVDGVTSNIQTQLNGKADASSSFHVGSIMSTIETNPGDDWALANGAILDRTNYPDMAKLRGSNVAPVNVKVNSSAYKNIVINDVIYVDGKYVGAGSAYSISDGKTRAAIFYTTNLLGSWDVAFVSSQNYSCFNYVIYAGGRYVANGTSNTEYGILCTSTTLVSTWQQVPMVMWPDAKFAYGNGYWAMIACKSGGYAVGVSYTTDITKGFVASPSNYSTTTVHSSNPDYLTDIQYLNGTWCVLQYSGSTTYLYTSKNIAATPWTKTTINNFRGRTLKYINNTYIISGYSYKTSDYSYYPGVCTSTSLTGSWKNIPLNQHKCGQSISSYVYDRCAIAYDSTNKKWAFGVMLSSSYTYIFVSDTSNLSGTWTKYQYNPGETTRNMNFYNGKFFMYADGSILSDEYFSIPDISSNYDDCYIYIKVK